MSNKCKSYLKWKKLYVFILQPKTQEQIYVEQVFRRLKPDLSKCDLSKKRLKHIARKNNENKVNPLNIYLSCNKAQTIFLIKKQCKYWTKLKKN